MNKFFSFTPEAYGFRTHETEEEAKKICKEELQRLRDDAFMNGWDEEASEEVCWGEIMQGAQKKEIGDDSVDYILIDYA